MSERLDTTYEGYLRVIVTRASPTPLASVLRDALFVHRDKTHLRHRITLFSLTFRNRVSYI